MSAHSSCPGIGLSEYFPDLEERLLNIIRHHKTRKAAFERIVSEYEEGSENSLQTRRRLLTCEFLDLYAPKCPSGFVRDPRDKLSKEQRSFRDELIQNYGSKSHREHKHDDYLWCPVLGRYCYNRDMRPCPIVSQNIPRKLVQKLCGPLAAAHMFSARNGFLLSSNVELAFVTGKILIVQTEDSPADRPEFEVIALDPNIYVGCGDGLLTRDIHGKRLQFLNDYRPGRQFLYLKYVFERLVQQDPRTPIEERSQVLEQLAKRKPWPRIGSRFTKSSLVKDMARLLGLQFDETMWQDVLTSVSESAAEKPAVQVTKDWDWLERQLLAGELITCLASVRRNKLEELRDGEWYDMDSDEESDDDNPYHRCRTH